MKMFSCDLTGDSGEGAGMKFVDVDIHDGLRVRVTPLRRIREGVFAQGEFGPKGVHLVEAAAATLQSPAYKKAMAEAIAEVQKGAQKK